MKSRAASQVREAVRGVLPFQVAGHFGAQKTARDRMPRIAAEFDRPVVAHVDQYRAGIRAIQGAHHMKDCAVQRCMHVEIIACCLPARERPSFGRGNGWVLKRSGPALRLINARG